MRASAKLFYAIAVFLGISGVVYVFGTVWIEDDGWKYRYDWAGGIPLLLSSLMAIMLGAYLHITESRSDVLPEDWEEAEISDSAGILGFFSPGSMWPFWMSISIFVFGLGVIFLYYWLILVGGVMLIWACTMLSLQYGLPKEKH
ncbi:aa3-type cytochrome oxidase subunit IV [Corynebacterium pseudodiphtheriticum]|uniref:Cytochrome c oxidase polypeptide 4 n=1 Tax=Corynebacterium pseudodiphtheriticum TaxID=37637 RepID=A0ABT7FYR7_9CORY|nr:cytochrome c oxidase subunit 4 [Corynebacterium pseudodiphtheriticum]MCG7251800.1 cytochrome c oxidase subunit 4 [Corynebacterium pseudodiphtheriticum]MDK4291134.1 cytochrome c oxidase subunit 4 [Corynebacterium pseudodiphtheriticum]MDK4339879.1 cytochrome c oxidase subunit 4 [Corynebacterium pseudodiphtheriticum]